MQNLDAIIKAENPLCYVKESYNSEMKRSRARTICKSSLRNERKEVDQVEEYFFPGHRLAIVLDLFGRTTLDKQCNSKEQQKTLIQFPGREEEREEHRAGGRPFNSSGTP